MATSGTYSYNPAAGDLVLQAYARCGIRRTQITSEHMENAFNEANLLLVDLDLTQPNLWTSELRDQDLVQGVKTYDIDPNTMAILIARIETTVGSGQTNERVIFPVSTWEYRSYPNPEQQGIPTVYWFDRTINPTITLWPVPDATATYVLSYQVVRQIQDVVLHGGLQTELPYRWLDAFCWGLAARLCAIYADTPEMTQKAVALDSRAERAWQKAASQDTEAVPLFLIPGLSSYWR